MSKSSTSTQTSTTELSYDVTELESLSTTSSKIRYLDSKGIKRGQIAKILNKRYQHVRNVLITPLKKQS